MHFLKCSDMANWQHTVLPANKPYLPLLPSCRASPPFGWYRYSFYHPMEGRRLSQLGWLVTYQSKVTPRESKPDTITHPSTNRAQHRLTSLIETNMLPLCQTVTQLSTLQAGWCHTEVQLWHRFLRARCPSCCQTSVSEHWRKSKHWP